MNQLEGWKDTEWELLREQIHELSGHFDRLAKPQEGRYVKALREVLV